jgi:hypothetical protein
MYAGQTVVDSFLRTSDSTLPKALMSCFTVCAGNGAEEVIPGRDEYERLSDQNYTR